MKVRQDSWHYKWIAKRWDEKPLALCWYFWKLVISIFLWIGAGIFAVIAGSFVIVTLTMPFWQWFFPEFSDLVVSIFSILCWVAIGSLILYHYRQYLYASEKLQRKSHKPPGLVAQYVNAKHRKICPLLKYE